MHSSTRAPGIITQNASWKYFAKLSPILDWLHHIFLPSFRHERHPDLLYNHWIWISIKNYPLELPFTAFCVRTGIDFDTQLIHKVLRRNQSYKLDLAAGDEGTRSAIIAEEQVKDRFRAVAVDYESSDNVCKVLHLWKFNTKCVKLWHNYCHRFVNYLKSFSSYLLGTVSCLNYLRPVQFIVHVCMLNEKLKCLDDKIKNPQYTPAQQDGNMESSSTEQVCRLIESYRQAYGKIWKQHELINDCFGFSILSITLIAFTNYAVTFYNSVLDNSKYVTMDFIVQPAVHTFHITILLAVLIKTCETSDELVSEIKHTSEDKSPHLQGSFRRRTLADILIN